MLSIISITAKTEWLKTLILAYYIWKEFAIQENATIFSDLFQDFSKRFANTTI